MNYDVKVSYDGLDTLVGTLRSNLEDVESSHTKSLTAAKTAIDAVGGESNDIGKAVSSKISIDTQSQLDDAMTIVANLIDAMTKVKASYSTQKDEILRAINKVTVESGDVGSSNTGSSTSNTYY